MLNLPIFMRLLRLMVWMSATCIGSLGAFALICSSLNPHPDAALFAMITLTLATGITLALPDQG